MLRTLTIAAVLALVVPALAIAEEDHHQGQGHPPGRAAPQARPAPHGPPPGPRLHGPPPAALAHPHGPPPAAFAHPGGPAGPQFSYGGHMINRVHIHPFVYPQGWAYRRWAVGAVLPPLFLVRDYWYADWATLGLPPPQPGYQWVRYGPDLLLVDVATGQVVDVAYGVFYD